MSYIKLFSLPALGESLDGARIVNWNVQVGQAFANGDVLLEIETDKSVVEIPAEESGRLVEQLIPKGEVLQGEMPVARIEVEGDAPMALQPDGAGRTGRSTPPAASAPSPREGIVATDVSAGATTVGRQFATPIARRLAQDHGIDLATVQGTGPRNRITMSDVMAVLPAEVEPVLRQIVGTPSSKLNGEPRKVATTYGELYARCWLAAQDTAAPTLLFLHGLFGDIDTWAGTLASLSRAGRNVIAIDLPCHGRSPANVARFDDMVDAVVQAAAKLCHGRIAWVGHSLGAAVAVRAARRMTPRLASVTLFAPMGLGTEIDQSFLDGMRHARSQEVLAREIGKLTAARVTPSAAFLQDLAARLSERAEPLAALCNDLSWNGVQQVSIRADIDALPCPVTIVHGRNDSIIPWQHVFNASARVALHLIPNVGHMPQSEALVLSDEIIERTTLRSAAG